MPAGYFVTGPKPRKVGSNTPPVPATVQKFPGKAAAVA